MIRSFIAIEVPAALREEIGRLQDRLRRTNADVKWVRPTGVHLTLKFLGDVPDDMIDPLSAAVGLVAEAVRPITLKTGALGVFPQRSRIRVAWLGLTGDLEPLAALQAAVEGAAAEFGFVPENRPFQPHLTLGRVASPRGREDLLAELDRLQPRNVEFTATEVVYYKSDLKPTGAVYTALKRLPLKG